LFGSLGIDDCTTLTNYLPKVVAQLSKIRAEKKIARGAKAVADLALRRQYELVDTPFLGSVLSKESPRIGTPNREANEELSICHWRMDGLMAISF